MSNRLGKSQSEKIKILAKPEPQKPLPKKQLLRRKNVLRMSWES
jgi:hypothetical protein